MLVDQLLLADIVKCKISVLTVPLAVCSPCGIVMNNT